MDAVELNNDDHMTIHPPYVRVGSDPMPQLAGIGAATAPDRTPDITRAPDVEPAPEFTPDITIVIPTRGEAGNVDELIARLDRALGATKAELLFVDDSDDHTPEVIRAAASRSSRPVRLLHREPGDRQGRLGGAVVAGFKIAHAPWAVVIDGDLQHPPEAVPSIVEARLRPGIDLVYGTRYVASGDAGGLSSRGRAWVSTLSTRLTRAMFPRKLRSVSDPMSGFFAVRLDALDLATLRPVGYKVLLEILAGSRLGGTAGVPFSFQPRFSGESKASLAEGGRFLLQLTALRVGLSVSRLTQLLAFLAVGVSGVVVNTVALWLLTGGRLTAPYLLASALATNIAVVWNFAVLETWVFRKARYRSRLAGFTRFWLVNMVLLPVQLGLLALAVEVAGMPPVAANLVVLTLVFVLRYLFTSAWVYSWKAVAPRVPAPQPASSASVSALTMSAVEPESGRPENERPKRLTWFAYVLRLLLPIVFTVVAFPAVAVRSWHLLHSGSSAAGVLVAAVAVVVVVVLQAAPKLGDADVHDRQVDVIMALPLLATAVWLSTGLSATAPWSIRELLAGTSFLAGSAFLLLGTRLTARLRWVLVLPLLTLPTLVGRPDLSWALALLVVAVVFIRAFLTREPIQAQAGRPVSGELQRLPKWPVATAVVTAVACLLAFTAITATATATGVSPSPTAQHAP